MKELAWNIKKIVSALNPEQHIQKNENKNKEGILERTGKWGKQAMEASYFREGLPKFRWKNGTPWTETV